MVINLIDFEQTPRNFRGVCYKFEPENNYSRYNIAW